VKQVLSDDGWKLVFEVSNGDSSDPLFMYETGPYEHGHYVGIFAKNWNLATAEFHVKFQGFRLEIT
jgi:hypothetical protein